MIQVAIAITPQSVLQKNMKRMSASTRAEIRTAYASGVGLRELARNMAIPEGTVPAR
jgi:DNA-directed RNA polymerase specialized sigma24 family protein